MEPIHRPRVIRTGALVAGLAAAAVVAVVDSPLKHVEGAGARPAYAAAVALLVVAWWLTEAVPMWVAALAPLVGYPLFGVYGPSVADNVVRSAVPYLDGYILLFMGGMLLGAAMEHTNLHRRIALRVMVTLGTRPYQLLAGVLVATALISMWISNTATAVMMVPISLAVVKRLEEDAGARLERYGCAMMLAVAWGANLGGVGTKIGTGTNSIFTGHMANVLHRDVGFVEFMKLAAPFVVLVLPVAWAMLWWMGRSDAPRSAAARDVLSAELAALGPLAGAQLRVAVCFGSAAVLWVGGDLLRAWLAAPLKAATGWVLMGKHVEAGVAMTFGLAATVLGRLSLASLRAVPWDTLLLLGGSFAMAAGLEASGFSTWMGAHLAGLSEWPLLVQLLAVSVASIAVSAVASNTATINLLLVTLPASPGLLLTAAMGASCDFALPAGTPPNAIVFGSGYVRLPWMMRVGGMMDLLAAVMLALYAYAWAVPMLG